MKAGILGQRLPHTLSPVIHAAIFRELGVQGTYGVFEREPHELDAFMTLALREGLAGFNVTIPYKTEAYRMADELSDEARRLGAVNTIRIEKGVKKGYNTDYAGFGHMLKKAGIDVRDRTVAVLGSGGSARAAAAYVKDAGARRVVVISRDPERARARFAGYAVHGYDGLEGDVLVNTTPCGMFPDVDGCPVDRAVVRRFSAAADIVYNPRETKLLKIAAECGLQTAGGLDMLVAQAVRAEEIWLGRRIADGVIEKIVKEL